MASGALSYQWKHPEWVTRIDPRLYDEREPTILFLLHASPFTRNPGGTEFHVRDLVEALRLKRAVIGFPGQRELVAAEVFEGEVGNPIFYRFALSETPARVCIDQPEATAVIKHWLGLFSISGVHIQHLIGWPITIGRMLQQLGIPYLYTSHDYYAICPNWNLFDYALERVCACTWNGDCDPGCLPEFAKVAKWVPSADLATVRHMHREAFVEFCAKASGLVFPSGFALQKVGEVLPLDRKRAYVIEHGCDVQLKAVRATGSGELRIGVIGGVAGPVKGYRNYRALVQRTSHLPVRWYFFGADELPDATQETIQSKGRVEFRGAYQRKDIADILASTGIDLCAILPNVDETFSYVLSEALVAGVPVMVNDRGSLAERVHKQGVGVVVSSIDEAYHWIENACRDRTDLKALSERVAQVKLPTNAENARAYLGIYQRLGLLSEGASKASSKPELVEELVARCTDKDPTTPPAEVAPQYQSTGWYPFFLHFKRYVPKAIRLAGRAALVSLESAKRWLRPPDANNTQPRQVSDLRLVKKRNRSLVYEPTGTHPSVLFDLKPFRPESVRAVHVRLGHRSPKARARLLWAHSFEERFSETKSRELQLNGGLHLRDYRFDMSGPEVGKRWRAGPEIVKLRLDLTTDGNFEIGPIELRAS